MAKFGRWYKMNVEHNYKTQEEKRKVIEYVDKFIGVDYEDTPLDDTEEGSLVFFEMTYSEFEKFVSWLKLNGYVKP